MKTIKQIADEIGVSKTAVFKRIKQEPLQTLLQEELSVDGNRVYVSEKGATIVKSAFAENRMQTENRKVSEKRFSKNDEKTATDDVVYGILKETISTLQKQLDVKDRQIEELTAIVKEQALAISADNQKDFAEKLIEGKQLVAEEPKRKWWQFNK